MLLICYLVSSALFTARVFHCAIERFCVLWSTCPHVYTERITSLSLEFELFHRDLWGCAMAEQNLLGFVWNVQVNQLHLVKCLHKNQKGDWISGCISAFFPFPPLQTTRSHPWGKFEQGKLELIWESYGEREKGLVIETALTWVLKSTIIAIPVLRSHNLVPRCSQQYPVVGQGSHSQQGDSCG